MSWIDPPLPAVRDVVARALAEDLGVLGDMTAEPGSRRRAGRRRHRGPPARCARRPAAAPSRPSPPSTPTTSVGVVRLTDGVEVASRPGDRRHRGPAGAPSSRPSAPPSTSWATSRASPPSPAGSSPPRRAGPGSATPARRRRACGRWRRPRSEPAVAPTIAARSERRHPGQGQPSRRPVHLRRRGPGPAPLARPGRGDRVRHPRTGQGGRRGGRRHRPRGQHDACRGRGTPSPWSPVAARSRSPVGLAWTPSPPTPPPGPI